MTLPANWSRMNPPAGFGRVVNGSKMRISWPFCAKVCEKSPWRCASVGTVVVVCDWRCLAQPLERGHEERLAAEDRSARDAAELAALEIAERRAARFAKKLFESKAESRKNS